MEGENSVKNIHDFLRWLAVTHIKLRVKVALQQSTTHPRLDVLILGMRLDYSYEYRRRRTVVHPPPALVDTSTLHYCTFTIVNHHANYYYSLHTLL